MKKETKFVLESMSYMAVLSTIIVYITAPIFIKVITLIGGIVYFAITHIFN